jgi:hypothetical protein
MSITEELHLYQQATEALEVRGHNVHRLSAHLDPDILADQITKLIMIEAHDNENR